MSDDINGAAPVADAAASVAPEPAAPAASFEDTMRAVADKHFPARDDAGRVAAKELTGEAAAPAATPASQESDQPEPLAVETAPPASSIEPPVAWSADAKAKWAALPSDVQRYIAQREGEAHKAITQTGERLKVLDEVDEVLGPRRSHLAATYGSEKEGLSRLFTLSDFASRDPTGFVQWFAQANRIDLSRLTPAPVDAGTPADPQIAALSQEVHHLKSTISQQQTTAAENSIRRFAEAKGENGERLYPHFDDVRADMGRIISAGIAETLEDAYAKATRTNDAVWRKVQAAEAEQRAKAAEAEQAKRKEAQAKAAADAKKAAAVNVRAVGAVSGSPGRAATFEDTMREVARRHYGSAA